MEKFGNFFEEFYEGQEFEHWPGKTITESDNNIFSLLTMNHHPLHIDANYCKDHYPGKILVVGTLVFSVVVGMTVAAISGKAIANLEYEFIKHHKPVFIGDTLYAITKVLNKRESRTKPDRGIVHVETMAKNQVGDIVLSFQRKVLIPKN